MATACKIRGRNEHLERLEDNFERFKSLLKTHLFRLAFDM